MANRAVSISNLVARLVLNDVDGAAAALKHLGVPTDNIDWADTEILSELDTVLKSVGMTDADRLNVLRAAAEGLPCRQYENFSSTPGVRIDSVIGVVRVCNFGTLSEVYQSRIMTVLNHIAEILHGVIYEHSGATIKNFGDTFLIVWQISETGNEMASHTADMAVLALAKVLCAVQLSPVLAGYGAHPGLKQRLGSNFRLQLSCGLHSGWVIKGAVGSDSRIEVSYVSPNLNIATNIVNATQIYGVPFLASESIVQRCSPKMGAICRCIDRVVTSGSTDPMELYSVDLDLRSLKVEVMQPAHSAYNEDSQRKVLEHLAEIWSSGNDVASLFDKDPNLIAMTKRYTVEFAQVFNMGYQNYIEGEWQVARRLLITAQEQLGNDEASAALLHFMETPFQFEAPRGWKGFRDLSRGAANGDLSLPL